MITMTNHDRIRQAVEELLPCVREYEPYCHHIAEHSNDCPAYYRDAVAQLVVAERRRALEEHHCADTRFMRGQATTHVYLADGTKVVLKRDPNANGHYWLEVVEQAAIKLARLLADEKPSS